MKYTKPGITFLLILLGLIFLAMADSFTSKCDETHEVSATEEQTEKILTTEYINK